jgi:hypothetical protein
MEWGRAVPHGMADPYRQELTIRLQIERAMRHVRGESATVSCSLRTPG